MIVPVILAGGAGTRLWPFSRQAYPKQFLRLLDTELSMLQLTLARLENLPIRTLPPIIICNEEHRFIVAEQLRKLNITQASIILEPVGKNTAPAITLAALQARALYPSENSVLCVLAADHFINHIDVFHHSLVSAYQIALQKQLVVFGVKPDSPHTGYGYIKTGNKLSIQDTYQLEKFVEKPDFDTAQQYLESQQYLWNSGMFVFQVDNFIQELEKYSPDILTICEMAFNERMSDLDFIRINIDIFKTCLEDSIDYAVMEKTQIGVVVVLDAGWSDLGCWSSLWEINPKDENNNVIHGDVIVEDAQNNYIHADSRLVTVLGVKDLIVIETKDAILVTTQSSTQNIKKLVVRMSQEKRAELLMHREVIRPWGRYDCIDTGERYQVKRITVKPKSKLSLQLHHHRAEHWIVVKGTAKVTKGDEQYFISENESTFIPLGTVHSLENPGSIALELIEIQSGSYLGEDDIIRFKDEYGRS
ncbi:MULTISPECIES: mannose-1-phosphate guanylyltransferase/mannose-6-phosphate isomerase [unclassified Acinetobacter]|uniref:mannose-1-phosphate guanylyltransferase/mannose-6-phosphate isomerase n=1 Tax=unclassified Acinetobacter TaxID=196816 RepID=UPI003C7EAD82